MTAGDPLAVVLGRLENVRKNGTGYTARCPTHDDLHNSLSIGRGDDGRVLLNDHAGCSTERIVSAAGLTMRDLFPPRQEAASANGHARRLVAAYDYRDEAGALLYQAVRFEPKGFAQRRPDGSGGWVWNLQGVRHVPYRLPELLAADPAAWVLIVEGEKDADRLAGLGFTATTNAAGAGKWRPEYNEHFRGRHVCILPDNDHPGKQHGESVARSLAGIAAEVRNLSLPDLPAKGDNSDWLDAGGSADELARLIEEAPRWEPNPNLDERSNSARRVRFVTAREFAQATPATTEFVDGQFVPVGGITKIDGPPKKAGKTTFVTHMIRAVLDGTDFLGKPTKRGPVVLLSEQGGTSLREALGRAGLLERDDLYLALYRDMAGISWPDVVEDAVNLAIEVGAVLLIVDTLPACSGVRGDDENSAGRALEALEPLQVAADAHALGVVVSFHDRKGGGEVGDSGRGSTAYAGAVDVILHITKPGGNFSPTIRRIEALSRFEATPDELYIELTDAGYVSLGSEGDVVSATLARALPDVLPDTQEAAKRIDNATEKDKETGEERIVERGLLDDLAGQGIKVARSTLDAELKRWLAGGYAGETGAGKKGSPHRYWMVAKPPDSFFRSKPTGASEERIVSDHAPKAPNVADPADSGPMRSSDAPHPSEETNEVVGASVEGGPIHSSDAPDAYSGRMNGSDGVGPWGLTVRVPL